MKNTVLLEVIKIILSGMTYANKYESVNSFKSIYEAKKRTRVNELSYISYYLFAVYFLAYS